MAAPGERTDSAVKEREETKKQEPTSYKVVLLNDEIGVVQPYLSTARGVESPTFLLRRRERRGLYDVFEEMLGWLSERSTPA